MTEEQKKAFAEKMKAARAAKKAQAPQSADKQQDPEIAAKMAQLDEALKKTNELNAQLEAKLGNPENFVSGKPASAQEIRRVEEVHKGKIAQMKEQLAAQPKVRVFVPTEGKEKRGTVLPVTINGYRLNIPKGYYVDVPQQVADIIRDSLNQTEEALSDNARRIDVDNSAPDKKEALSL